MPFDLANILHSYACEGPLVERMLELAIIGGGLSGLSLAQQLHEAQHDFTLFEARERFGGRIHTHVSPAGFAHDLGPSWIWPATQPNIAALIERLGLASHPQWLDGHSLYQSERHTKAQVYVDHDSYAQARRVEGGMMRLVEGLLALLPRSALKPGHALQALVERGDHIELQFVVDGEAQSITARKVVLTLPPRLLVECLAFEPSLDVGMQRAMQETPTWMAGQAKAVIHYQRPFWREMGLSGSVLASYQGAALSEVFDVSPANGEYAALSGFMALPAALRERYRDDLEALILEQLVRLFGQQAAQAEEILICDWFFEGYTAGKADEVLPLAHPHYGHPLFQQAHWNGKLYLCGTETATEYGGFLEGALVSSARVMKQLFA